MVLFKTKRIRLLLLMAGSITMGAGCSTVKNATTSEVERPASSKVVAAAGPTFIDDISFKPGNETSANSTKNTARGPSVNSVNTLNSFSADGSLIEDGSELRFKYSILLDEPVEELANEKLLGAMEDWYGTRYRLGGTDKNGIDCSAFVQTFLASLYGVSTARTCREQYAETRRIKKSNLQEGDLVFFKTRGKSISHVGVYLRNNKFIHASTSSGVMISDLNEGYFSSRYAGAGRYQ